MQSNLLLFLLFSIIASLTIRLLSNNQKKYGLFCFNIIFYLLCDPRFLILMLASILWSFKSGQKIESETSKNKLWLFFGIFPIVLILILFKYFNFFISQIGSGTDALSILMPLGISYYTFKIISYMADIYLKKRPAEVSILSYGIYVSFFPQIICGPISRSEEITKQLSQLQNPSSHMLAQGSILILSGLFKKLVIADRLNLYVNAIFSDTSSYPALALWIAAFFYTIQIYCDFSGYSELAIGTGNLLGINCQPNFHLPYFSYSIKDFWRKWHISLSSWLKDYIYIPLGGNRSSITRKNINILVTFLVSGLWHGSGLNFIVWGLWHGLLNLIPFKKSSHKILCFVQMLFTFMCVMFGWILFKASSLLNGLMYIIQMFQNLSINRQTIISTILPFTGDYSCVPYFLTVCIFILVLFIIEFYEYIGRLKNDSKGRCLKCFIYLTAVILFGMIGQNSFLYANF